MAEIQLPRLKRAQHGAVNEMDSKTKSRNFDGRANVTVTIDEIDVEESLRLL